MYATRLHKLLVATALAGAALGLTPFAQASVGSPQKHEHIIAVKRPHIIAVKHPDIIAILKHPDIIAVKHPDIIAILKQTGFLMRKAGGDSN